MYYKFLTTLATFIVNLVKIDADKDGKVERSEIMSFLTASVIPLVLNSGQIRDEVQDLIDRFRTATYDEIREDLLKIVALQLLPGEMSSVEEKVDLILGGVYKILSGVEDIQNGFQAFGIGQPKDNFEDVVIKSKAVSIAKKKLSTKAS